ncbi:M24 family metallopeptidase [Planctomicrobium piriforme]|uniref:Xaa-Pro aminopeptidase n=1 Tax=Planctomicrobium piriforme TaxID=1576369 RepID=A0A1I3QX96_9PLAN|nr:M24 family metallopeptidase [Planctomicrobium piriforme]SFJ38688.1 Xaa-Pro aminopeptidase [Planctomicrobium piriforme]
MATFDLQAVQSALREFQIDGWLLYDFRGINPLARNVLQLPAGAMGSRRWAYGIPAHGEPLKLVHRIEDSALDHVPGQRTIYLRWQEFEAGIASFCQGKKTIAMEYSPGGGNPYISRVDAGTIELVRSFGVDVVSSGNLIQLFEATWSDAQWQQHLQAAVVTHSAYDVAWKLIADKARSGSCVSEKEVEQAIMDHFHAHGLTTYHPPIVARNEHSGSPHYETGTGSDTLIREGDFVLIDLWAKLDQPGSVYSDLTRVGYVGQSVPQKFVDVFQIVAAARDRGIETVRQAFAVGRPIQGAEVDDAVRQVIEQAGYGKYFAHRTGHNIGQEVHGNGAHIDNLETREDRLLLRRTCFSIEPGIYLDDFGVRLEVDVYIDGDGQVQVTGGMLQSEVIPVLSDY